jgi:hypothetical protein
MRTGDAMTAEQLTAASTLADRRLSACIDVHHHMLPPRYVEHARDRLLGNAPAFADVLRWTPQRSFETMERNGIDKAVLSLTQPGLRFEDVPATRAMIRYCNEFGAGLVRDTHILFGTDYPYFQPQITIEPMEHLSFDAARLSAIARDNALRLFPRLRG